ncbi:MAG TPA: hypothetical protein VM409_08500, partial [Chloroflexia bacterium]|nr:hypothetical protein [Chloroflexia bacterium]
MATQDLERVRYVTTNYNYLQGLKMVPIGLVFLALAAFQGGWLPAPNVGSAALNITGIGLAFVLAWAANLYYSRTFGRVLPAPIIPRNPNWAAIIGVWTAGLALLLGTILLDALFHLPVILFGLVMSALIVAYYWPRRSFAAHYLAIAGIIAAISVFPAFGVNRDNPAFSSYIFSSLSLGLIFVVGGLFDHILLANTLKPVPE